MATIAEIRRQYPQYKDLSDTQLADALHSKFYRDIPKDEFYVQAGLETSVLRDVGGAAVQGVGQIVSLPGQIFGLATGDMDNISTRAGQSVEQFGEELQTPAFRERQRQQAERVAKAEEDGMLAGFGQQAKELLTDPLSLAAGIAQTAPAMIGTGGVGLAGRAAATRLIGQQAARRGALAGAATGEAAIVSGDAAQSTFDRVMAMPEEVVARSDAYRAAIAEGSSPEEARNAAAISAARRAAAIAAPIAAVTGPLGLEAALLTGGLRRGAIRSGAEGLVREGGTEVVQETGQGVAENVGAQSVDPSVQLTEGLGGRAAAGLILGGTMGGLGGGISGLVSSPEGTPNVEIETGGGAVGGDPTSVPVTPPVPDVGTGPTGGGVATGPTPTTVIPPNVTIEDDIVIIEDEDGNITRVPRAEWEAGRTPVAAPPVEPVVAPPVEPVVTPPVDVIPVEPVAAPPVEPAPVEPAAPPVTPTAAPAPVPVNTPSGPIEVTPPTQPISATPIEDVEPITPEQFAEAERATAEIESMIAGKTMPQVARELGNTATLDTTRVIMPRVANILESFEKAGINLRIGVQTNKQSGVPGITMSATTRGKAAWRAWDSSMNVVVKGMYAADPGTSERTLAHELIHAVTALSINNQDNLPPNSRIGDAVKDLKSLSRIVAKKMREDQKAGTLLWNDKYRKYRQDPNEVLAWGLTDSNFQNYLKTVQTKTGNAFTDFVRYVGKLLGIAPKDQNALARLIDITDRIIPEGQQDVTDVAIGAARTLSAPGIGIGVTGVAPAIAPPPPPSAPPPPSPTPSSAPQPKLALPKETRAQGFTRRLVDRFERLRVVQSLGQLAAGVEGFYEAARKFDSRAGELMQKFDRDYFKPIQAEMRKAGLNLDTVDFYLYALAAPARNARLREKAENEVRRKTEESVRREMEREGATETEIEEALVTLVPDAIEKAYEDGEIPTAGSGITTREAEEALAGFEGMDYYPALQRISDLVNRANRERMENNIQRGLVSRDAGERLLIQEPNYVPMKGFAADENLTEPAEDFESTMGYGGTGFGVGVREWYDTRGRSGKPFSPLGTFISDVETSVVRGERNRVGQKMMDFFIDNPSSEWSVFSDRNPPRDSKGNIRKPSPFDPNFMIVKRGGNTFYLRINDPLLAKAAKGLNQQQMNAFLQISNKITRLLSRSFTTANPDFFVPNVFRDLQSAALNLAADAPGLAKAFGKNVKDTKAFRTIAAFEYGRAGGDPDLRQLYEQFKLDGGSVSWAVRETPQEVGERIQRDLKTVNDSLKDIKNARTAKQVIDAVWSPTSKGFGAMVGAMENTNAIFENGIRFAAYRAALETGMSREKAAMISREATVDFNRRGEAGALLNALYAFFNAGIQGSVRTARALSNNPFKTGKLSSTQSALLGMMATAGTLAAANAAASDEDDDGKLFWDKIPDYEKERNLIIMHPNGRDYEKIPMPYGFGFFPYLATRFMDAARRGDDAGAVGLDVTAAALGNFSPIQFGAGSAPSSVARAITPTVFKPFTELALNENFMGKPIYNEPFDSAQSYASVARYNTPEGYKELSQFLNDISGGEGKVKGKLNMPPESFEYLVEFSLGGLTNLAKSLYRTADEGDVMAAPVVRRLVGQPSKGRNVGEYYEREEKARVVNQQMKELNGEERRALREQFPVETSTRVQSALTAARSRVRELNKQRKVVQGMNINEADRAEKLERLRERIDGEYVRFNRVYNDVEQATR